MDLDELAKTTHGNPSFFKHVFNFDDESKIEMLNIIQYAVIALLPVVILNKIMQKYVPEADDEKNSPELLAEIVAQVVVLFIGILLIHRIITFVPNYSGEKYADFSITNIILAFLVIILSLQTKLGEKVSILVDRFMALWDGQSDKKNKKGNVKVTQPIAQQQSSILMTPQMNSGSTPISSLPPSQAPQQDFNQMYQQEPTPLVGAASPAGMDEPMAANSGGGGFGSAFGGW